ncbi:hypothetical protein D3C79_650350 [compost metagenome]
MGGGGFRGPVVLHQHGFDQTVAGLAGGLIGLELGLQPFVHNHPDHTGGLVDEVHGVEAEIADSGVHHDGVSHRVIVDVAALVHGFAIDNLIGRGEGGIRADRLVQIQPRDIGQHKFVQHHGALIGQAVPQVTGKRIGNNLTHGDRPYAQTY